MCCELLLNLNFKKKDVTFNKEAKSIYLFYLIWKKKKFCIYTVLAELDLAGSLTVFNRTGEENMKKKPMGSKKHRAIAYQLLPQTKKT